MKATDLRRLTAQAVNYDVVGATRPQDEHWSPEHAGYRAFERTVPIGHGTGCWEAATGALFRWAVKTRSGFTVEPARAGHVRWSGVSTATR
ncbi:DUF1990 family protein [Actinacidiphila glaucinigra]|uniref:DUF1990 family protein n=1 Tax=Actinacidiphila glaucinigra TaxID=235986 RepID=UPI0035D8EB36